MKAPEILKRSAEIMAERAKQYDSPQGERSMGKAVAAFNAITGQSLSEANGWLLMALLKMVRDNTTEDPHEDSIHDLVAYAGLYGEARLSGLKGRDASESASKTDGEWITHDGGAPNIPVDCYVEYKMRGGAKSRCTASSMSWEHHNNTFDIIAYRIVK